MTTLFLLMLCNDRAVLGPWVNPPWLKALASVIVGALVLLSVTLTMSTIFPHIDVTAVALAGGGVLVVVLAGMGVATLRSHRGAGLVTVIEEAPDVPKEQWTMPPATLLSRPQFSTSRQVGMYVLGGYMVLALVMLIVKSVQLAGG
jgi:hypothetical protein